MINKTRNEILPALFMSIAPEYEYIFDPDTDAFMSTFPFYKLESDYSCVLSTKVDLMPANFGLVTPKKIYRTSIPFRLSIDTLKLFDDSQTNSIVNELYIEDSIADKDIEITDDALNKFKTVAKRRKICKPLHYEKMDIDESKDRDDTSEDMTPTLDGSDSTKVFTAQDLSI
jgi:hypothetical protein